MEKQKKVRKLIPVEHEDIFSLEEYFRQMSLMGLHFEKFFGYGVFIKGDNISYRYRIEPIDTSRAWPDHEKMCYYEECGWEFVNKFGNMYEVYRTDSENDTELHTDPVAESYGYENIVKRMKNDMVGMGIYNVLLLGSIFGIYFLTPTPALLLVESASFILPLAVISLIFSAFGSANKYKKIKHIKDLLQKGQDARNVGEINYKSRFRTYFDFWGNLAFCGVLIMLLISNFTGSWHRSIDEIGYDLPYIPIEILCKDDGFYVPEKPFAINGVDAYSHVRRDNSALAKDIYRIWESGYLKDEDFYEGKENTEGYSTDFFVTSDTDVYILRLRALAYPLVEDIMTENSVFEFREIADDRFDHLYVGYYAESQLLVAAKDKRVIAIKFRVDIPGSKERFDITENLRALSISLEI
ncbi:MAG: DUF2812 domain-containing protein [Eubacteriaceae bacterium]|nr:DUF2812 domain-containing protein [Eubacteriaceae bacterium]